jgi:hypothetical protein
MILLDSVSVLREISKLRANSIIINSMNQSVESSTSQIDEWDQADFDELHPSLKANDPKNPNKKS